MSHYWHCYNVCGYLWIQRYYGKMRQLWPISAQLSNIPLFVSFFFDNLGMNVIYSIRPIYEIFWEEPNVWTHKEWWRLFEVPRGGEHWVLRIGPSKQRLWKTLRCHLPMTKYAKVEGGRVFLQAVIIDSLCAPLELERKHPGGLGYF